MNLSTVNFSEEFLLKVAGFPAILQNSKRAYPFG